VAKAMRGTGVMGSSSPQELSTGAGLIMKLPSRSVRAAAFTEKILHKLGLKRLTALENLAESAKARCLARHSFAFQPLMEIEMNGVRLTLPSYFVPHYLDRKFEPLTTRKVRRYLKRGMVVIDVGAQVGYYTLLAAQCVGPQGRILAVEPAEENLKLLRGNVARARAAQVVIFPFAAGEREVVRKLNITDSSDSHGFYRHPFAPTLRTELVQQLPLDALVDGRVDFVKIDVEGAEIEVLRGMSRITGENRHLKFVVEWNPACLEQAGYDPATLIDILEGQGLRLTVLDEHAGRAKSVAEIAPLVRSGSLPRWWFANLWAECDG